MNRNLKLEANRDLVEMSNDEFLQKFEADGRGAFATGRILQGLWERENCQEWKEYGLLEGKPVVVFWMFENHEAEPESGDGSDIPFDSEHMTHFEFID